MRTHRNKPKKWVMARYHGAFNKTRRDRWVFGDRDTGAYLTKIAWTPIVRHQMVDGFASLDDPTLRDYWAARKRRRTPPINRRDRIQLAPQRGPCPICGDPLPYADTEPQTPDERETWITTVRRAIRRQAITEQPGTNDGPSATRLVHTHCARQLAARRSSARQQNHAPPGLA